MPASSETIAGIVTVVPVNVPAAEGLHASVEGFATVFASIQTDSPQGFAWFNT